MKKLMLVPGRNYYPQSPHQIASWAAIVACIANNGGQASFQQLVSAVSPLHPTSSQGKHILWHLGLVNNFSPTLRVS